MSQTNQNFNHTNQNSSQKIRIPVKNSEFWLNKSKLQSEINQDMRLTNQNSSKTIRIPVKQIIITVQNQSEY